MVYSQDRLLYPMKRVDFDPKGERNPQNRGISGYERISWDEALEMVTDEIRRVKRDHGPGAIMNGSGSHHTWGHLGYLAKRAESLLQYSSAPQQSVINPDSWEGWYWGAAHHWGYSAHNGGGETYGTVEDCLKNAEMIVFWSSRSGGDQRGLWSARRHDSPPVAERPGHSSCVHIDPYYNHTAAWLGGKWLAPRPGTDSAMVLAIAHVWMTEGLYDKDYVANRTVGFEKWREHVLGNDDGVPKTPEWQESETGVAAKDVRALARRMGLEKDVSGGRRDQWIRRRLPHRDRNRLGAGHGLPDGHARAGQAGREYRLPAARLAGRYAVLLPGLLRRRIVGRSAGHGDGREPVLRGCRSCPSCNPVQQRVPRLKIPEAIMDGHCEGYPTDPRTIEGQFFKFQYPAPGHSPVKIYYKYGGSNFGTMPDSNRYVRMYRTDKLECVINQAIWLEGETKFADIILPACTNFERWDISEFANCSGYIHHSFTQCNHRVAVLQQKCIEPLGESKSDFQIFPELSKRLGLGFQYSEGSTELDWCRRLFEATDLP